MEFRLWCRMLTKYKHVVIFHKHSVGLGIRGKLNVGDVQHCRKDGHDAVFLLTQHKTQQCNFLLITHKNYYYSCSCC